MQPHPGCKCPQLLLLLPLCRSWLLHCVCRLLLLLLLLALLPLLLLGLALLLLPSMLLLLCLLQVARYHTCAAAPPLGQWAIWNHTACSKGICLVVASACKHPIQKGRCWCPST